MTKTPARPQLELPILSTHDGSGEGVQEEPPRVDADELDDDEEVVLIAITSPARTMGSTNPELIHFVS